MFRNILSSRKLEEIVVMGKVLVPYGVNGWVKVYSFTEKIESFFIKGIISFPKSKKLVRNKS